MSVELEFPLEFVVEGTAVSSQAARRESLTQWKERIVAASRPSLPENHFLSRDALTITLFYFPAAAMQGDIDNIVKPILDALCRHIYMDDRQLHRVLVQKFEPGNIFGFTSPSVTLANAIGKPKPALYVRLSNDPFEDLV
jgi:crossover junction endodeoxyribonuclease RusA